MASHLELALVTCIQKCVDRDFVEKPVSFCPKISKNRNQRSSNGVFHWEISVSLDLLGFPFGSGCEEKTMAGCG